MKQIDAKWERTTASDAINDNAFARHFGIVSLLLLNNMQVP